MEKVVHDFSRAIHEANLVGAQLELAVHFSCDEKLDAEISEFVKLWKDKEKVPKSPSTSLHSLFIVITECRICCAFFVRF